MLCVATAADGAREAIEDDVSGFVCEPRNIPAIAESIEKLVDDAELRRRMGDAGRTRAQEFDIDTSVASLDQGYRRVLADGGAGRTATAETE